jgi:hypothetical protein
MSNSAAVAKPLHLWRIQALQSKLQQFLLMGVTSMK